MSYKVKLAIFEGPLDLLLYLIKKDHVNIYDIPIAQITKEYLEYIELMCLLDLNIAGEFLVMAATLLEIKSKMLLPPPEIVAQEQLEELDPRAELVKRLLEYGKFKQAAGQLRGKEQAQQFYFGRSPKEDEVVADSEIFFEAGIFDLIAAFTKALKDVPRDVFYEVVKDEFTVEDKIHTILHLLLVQQHIQLSNLFGSAKNKLEIVALFLAILELIRLKEIIIRQKSLFGDIEITRNSQNISPYGKQSRETADTKRE
ncbi:MAG: segregation/condensation protein A [Candidatus Omnitrophota bacterium]